VKAYIDKFNQ
jgi:hypothetical protein